VRKRALFAVVLAVAVFAPVAALASTSGPGGHAHIAKRHKKKHHHHRKTTPESPSLTVVGFGMNHLYVADGTTVTAPADCSTMVQGNGYPEGPPQNVYVEAYVKATDIPASSPTQIGEDTPEDDDTVRMAADALTLSPPVPYSQAFGASTLGFGTPPGSQTDIFRGGLFGENDPNGPSASDFDGTYSFEASVDVNGKTLDSTATVTVSC
jgi:hypothetical protein